MYENLIETLRFCAKNGDCHDCPNEKPCAGDDLYCEAADAIEERQSAVKKLLRIIGELEAEIERSKRERRWIPVAERLPDCFYGEEIGNVEWISHGTVYAGCFGRGGIYRDAYFRTWNDATEGIDAINAEYWRFALLPESPKEET